MKTEIRNSIPLCQITNESHSGVLNNLHFPENEKIDNGNHHSHNDTHTDSNCNNGFCVEENPPKAQINNGGNINCISVNETNSSQCASQIRYKSTDECKSDCFLLNDADITNDIKGKCCISKSAKFSKGVSEYKNDGFKENLNNINEGFRATSMERSTNPFIKPPKFESWNNSQDITSWSIKSFCGCCNPGTSQSCASYSEKIPSFGIFNPGFIDQSNDQQIFPYNKKCCNISQPIKQNGLLRSGSLPGVPSLFHYPYYHYSEEISRMFYPENICDELRFRNWPQPTGNVIQNSAAKEAPFILGPPPKRKNALKEDKTLKKQDSLSSGYDSEASKSIYILPIPQGNESEPELELRTASQDDLSDNFCQSEYLQFKNAMIPKSPKEKQLPVLKKSFSLPQSSDVPDTASSSISRRKFSYPLLDEKQTSTKNSSSHRKFSQPLLKDLQEMSHNAFEFSESAMEAFSNPNSKTRKDSTKFRGFSNKDNFPECKACAMKIEIEPRQKKCNQDRNIKRPQLVRQFSNDSSDPSCSSSGSSRMSKRRFSVPATRHFVMSKQEKLSIEEDEENNIEDLQESLNKPGIYDRNRGRRISEVNMPRRGTRRFSEASLPNDRKENRRRPVKEDDLDYRSSPKLTLFEDIPVTKRPLQNRRQTDISDKNCKPRHRLSNRPQYNTSFESDEDAVMAKRCNDRRRRFENHHFRQNSKEENIKDVDDRCIPGPSRVPLNNSNRKSFPKSKFNKLETFPQNYQLNEISDSDSSTSSSSSPSSESDSSDSSWESSDLDEYL